MELLKAEDIHNLTREDPPQALNLNPKDSADL